MDSTDSQRVPVTDRPVAGVDFIGTIH